MTLPKTTALDLAPPEPLPDEVAELFAKCQEKLGLVKDPDPTPAMLRGLALEDIVAIQYQLQTGRKLRKVKENLQHT